MAWTTPLTATSNTALTAAQWNASVRDNLLQTAPALATTAGGMFATTGANAIAQRIPSSSQVSGSDVTAFTSYVDLNGGANPVVTVTCGVAALVSVGALAANSTSGANTFCSYAVSGANTIAGTDATSLGGVSSAAGATAVTGSRVRLETGLAAGSNTFTEKYRVSTGTGTFSNRHIAVVPF